MDESKGQAGGVLTPVAWMWQHEETGNVGFVDALQVEYGWQEANPRLKLIGPLFTRPTPAAAAGVPTGWKLVPVEPTLDMLDVGSGWFRTRGNPKGIASADGCWSAMLAASPVAPAGAPTEWSKLSDAEVLRIAPIQANVSLDEQEAFCAGFRRCAMALLSAGSQAEGAHQDASVHEALSTSNLASPSPLPSPRATGRSELPREPL